MGVTPMKRSFPLCVAVVTFCVASAAQLACAAIVTTGDLEPANPSTWTNSTDGYIGNTASGTLTVNSGSDLYSYNSYLGYSSGVKGLATVGGTGSTWSTGHELDVGCSGSGTLEIRNGAIVTNGWTGYGWTYIGRSTGSTGVVTVDGSNSRMTNGYILGVGDDGNGTLNISGGGTVEAGGTTFVGGGANSTGLINFSDGTLTTRSLAVATGQLTGTGTINTHGLITNLDLVFDSQESLKQAIQFHGQTGGTVTVNLDLSGDPSTNGALVLAGKATARLLFKMGLPSILAAALSEAPRVRWAS